MATHLLPVKVEAERRAETVQGEDPTLSPGSHGNKLPRGTLRIAGAVDVVALRTEPVIPF